ncbi:hypothetical protein HGRIS_014432 [Hohenbuehelia grisea]|uniref:Haloacid dehalogenase n=1 Tax=Hohenbuehelia grisea TaxID=104357 RepID=A0ABR3JUU9_9AGAR
MTMGNLQGVEALVFDVFGTVVDWRSSVVDELGKLGKKTGADESTDWTAFANEWRKGYMQSTRNVADGAGVGPLNVDVLHRELLDKMLASPSWSKLGALWQDEERKQLNLAWHRLNGWPDSSEGLKRLKKTKILATLSNGNVRLLVDMAKFADLPWDVIFSTELFGSFKPHPKTYLGAAHHLSLPPSSCAMVAAHIFDLRAAASNGMKTIYVRRLDEDVVEPESVTRKEDGGEVDYVVDSLTQLAELFEKL